MRRQCFSIITAMVLVTILAAGSAGAANGTLNVTFNNASGVAQQYAYVYLRNANVPPPVEKFFSPADYIFGPSDATGNINVSVPEGQYFIRIIKRSASPYKPLGPPEPNDLTWMQVSPITITAGATTNLGSRNGGVFRTSKISGILKLGGVPAAGKYVRAQTVPCQSGGNVHSWSSSMYEPNYCGPVKLLAEQRTDANGAYSISFQNTGNYYLVVSDELGKTKSFPGAHWDINRSLPNWNNPTRGRTAVGPFTVVSGAELIVNIDCQAAQNGTCSHTLP